MSRAQPQHPIAPTVAVLAAASVVVAASAPFGFLEPPAVESTRASCPPGYTVRPARAQRIRALLRTTQRGRTLLGRKAAVLPVCFRPTDEPAFMGELVVLDERVGDGENAARLGHLLLHGTQAAMLTVSAEPHGACSAPLDELVNAEAEAHALELELRRELGVSDPLRPFAFEQAFWSAPAEERTELVRTFLVAHPDGAPGVPGLVGAYRHRCAGEVIEEGKAEPRDGASPSSAASGEKSRPAEHAP